MLSLKQTRANDTVANAAIADHSPDAANSQLPHPPTLAPPPSPTPRPLLPSNTTSIATFATIYFAASVSCLSFHNFRRHRPDSLPLQPPQRPHTPPTPCRGLATAATPLTNTTANTSTHRHQRRGQHHRNLYDREHHRFCSCQHRFLLLAAAASTATFDHAPSSAGVDCDAPPLPPQSTAHRVEIAQKAVANSVINQAAGDKSVMPISKPASASQKDATNIAGAHHSLSRSYSRSLESGRRCSHPTSSGNG